ncbi:hypothetical protein GCM10029964_091490 [Kibdelosporangium lantanae]
MAVKVEFSLVDDLDGSESDDVERMTFGLDGTTYEIDLTAVNAGQLRGLLARYIDAARRIGTPALQLPRLYLAHRASA